MNETITAAEVAMALSQPPEETSAAIPVSKLLQDHLKLRQPVIHGLLRRGESMNVIAPSKTGKSWLVLALAMCVATGRRWLDTFDTAAVNVLIIDNELHLETIAHRIPKVAAALGIHLDEISETLSVRSLRGQLRDIFGTGQYLASIDPGSLSLVVLDAFYRFMPMGMDKDDNGTMADIYNHIDALADELGCSFVLIHHSTKGSQSGKAVTDVGAGSQSRAADTHLILRQHQEAGAVVLEAAVRSWPPGRPVVLRSQFPVWMPAMDLDPAALLGGRKAKSGQDKNPQKPPPPERTAEQFVETFISEQPLSKAEIRQATKGKPGLSIRAVDDLIEVAESRGLIHRWKVGKSHRVLFATIPQPTSEETSR